MRSTAHRRAVPAAVALATALGLTLTAGCSGGDGEFSIAAMVGELPDPGTEAGSSLLVQAADLDRAEEILGVTGPTGDAPPSEEWLTQISGIRVDTPVYLPLPDVLQPQSTVQVVEENELGWSLGDVSSYASVSSPPQGSLVVRGDFTDESLSSSLTDLGDGVLSAGEGDDNQIGQPTALRPLGAPLRLARDGDEILVSRSTETVRTWKDGGEQATLADRAGLVELGTRLDDADAVSALMVTPIDPVEVALGTRLDPAQIESQLAELESWVIATPFDAVAIGWLSEQDGPRVAVAYHFGSESLAQGAVEQVKKAWTDGIQVQSTRPLSEVATVDSAEAEGSSVVVRLTPVEGTPLSVFASMVMQREAIFSYR